MRVLRVGSKPPQDQKAALPAAQIEVQKKCGNVAVFGDVEHVADTRGAKWRESVSVQQLTQKTLNAEFIVCNKYCD